MLYRPARNRGFDLAIWLPSCDRTQVRNDRARPHARRRRQDPAKGGAMFRVTRTRRTNRLLITMISASVIASTLFAGVAFAQDSPSASGGAGQGRVHVCGRRRAQLPEPDGRVSRDRLHVLGTRVRHPDQLLHQGFQPRLRPFDRDERRCERRRDDVHVPLPAGREMVRRGAVHGGGRRLDAQLLQGEQRSQLQRRPRADGHGGRDGRHHDGVDEQEAHLVLLRRIGLPLRIPPAQAHLGASSRTTTRARSRRRASRRSAPGRTSSPTTSRTSTSSWIGTRTTGVSTTA